MGKRGRSNQRDPSHPHTGYVTPQARRRRAAQQTPGHSMDSNESHVNQPARQSPFLKTCSLLRSRLFLPFLDRRQALRLPTLLLLIQVAAQWRRFACPLLSNPSSRFAAPGNWVVGRTSTSRPEISPVESVKIPRNRRDQPWTIYHVRPQPPNIYYAGSTLLHSNVSCVTTARESLCFKVRPLSSARRPVPWMSTALKAPARRGYGQRWRPRAMSWSIATTKRPLITRCARRRAPTIP